MGVVNLPTVEPRGHKSVDEYLFHVANVLAMIQEDLQNLLEGRLSANNIRAESIETRNLKAGAVTAEKIQVDELSAISADMGKITAGEVYGAYIATSEGQYPFIEFSSTAKLLQAWADALNYMRIVASVAGNPALVMSDGVNSGALYFGEDPFTGTNKTTIQGDTGVRVTCDSGDVDFETGLYKTTFPSWSAIYNRATSRTFQQDLDAKANAFSGFTGAFSTGTQTVYVSNGIITAVV